MDKETLSNYGWIVILVLILAVMLALATPFGSFIAGAVKSTTQGLFDVNQNALNSTGLINIDGQTFGEGGNGGSGGAGDQGNQGGTGDQGVIDLPAVGISAEDCTWAEIKAISEAGKGDEYFNLGDTKTITTTDGQTITMAIVAFNADPKTDGTGTAGITWMSTKCVADKRINETANNNEGGWKECTLRGWLQNDFYNTLPDDVKNQIVFVNKTYFDYGTQSTLSCSDNLWIPSVGELWGNNYDSDGCEDSGPKYTTNRDKCVFGFLLRTAYSGASWGYRYANQIHGSLTYGSGAQYYTAGVVLGFCT